MYAAASENQPTVRRPDCGDAGAIAALRQSRLEELARLFRIGADQAKRLEVVAKGLPPEQEIKLLVGRKGSISEFDRISRAVRQIVVLEFELLGVFPAPDRDAIPAPIDRDGDEREAEDYRDRERSDLNDLRDRNDLNDLKDRSDYSRGPLDEVVAGVRKALGAEPPENDPFAPRKPRPAPTGVRVEPVSKERRILARRHVAAAVKAGVKTAPSLKAKLLRGVAARPLVQAGRGGALPSGPWRSRPRGPPD